MSAPIAPPVGLGGLRARGLTAGYHGVPVVHDLDLDVLPGRVTVLLGPNGAGKTTTLRALSGAIKPLAGGVELDGRQLHSPVHRRCREGLAYVPEGRLVFRSLSVRDNLKLGQGSVDEALAVMPELAPHLGRPSGLLSGGQQQMLVLARALASTSPILLADELSLGLAPTLVRRLLALVRESADAGRAVLLVEQHVRAALAIADHAYVLTRGEIVISGAARDIRARLPEIEAAYLSGIGEPGDTQPPGG